MHLHVRPFSDPYRLCVGSEKFIAFIYILHLATCCNRLVSFMQVERVKDFSSNSYTSNRK